VKGSDAASIGVLPPGAREDADDDDAIADLWCVALIQEPWRGRVVAHTSERRCRGTAVLSDVFTGADGVTGDLRVAFLERQVVADRVTTAAVAEE
jgi:hypothetical protein